MSPKVSAGCANPRVFHALHRAPPVREVEVGRQEECRLARCAACSAQAWRVEVQRKAATRSVAQRCARTARLPARCSRLPFSPERRAW